MNEFLILLILKLKPLNIYELKKFIDENFAPFLQVSVGMIIPALNRLEKAKAVKKEATMTGGGLKRSVYSLDENAENLINEYLQEEITSAPQLLRREVDVLMFVYGSEAYFTQRKREEKNYPLTRYCKPHSSATKSISPVGRDDLREKVVGCDFSHQLSFPAGGSDVSSCDCEEEFCEDNYSFEYLSLLSPEQKKLMHKKIENALKNNIKLLNEAIKYNQINPEFLNMELIYAEAKLRSIS